MRRSIGLAILELSKEQVLERLTSADANRQLFGVEYSIFSFLHDPEVASAVKGLVGLSTSRDYGVSLGEWAEIYLDLAEIKAYAGTNPYATEMLAKIRGEIAPSASLA